MRDEINVAEVLDQLSDHESDSGHEILVREADVPVGGRTRIVDVEVEAERKEIGIASIAIDLATIRMAISAGHSEGGLAGRLSRLADELQSLSLAVALAIPASVTVDHEALAGISSREAEVLSLLVSGKRVRSIGEDLHISRHTVRNHLKSMFRKFEVGTQAELIEFVRELSTREVAKRRDRQELETSDG